MKICSKCQQKNPKKVEIHDLASGKMVWEVLTKCMKCRHSLDDALILTNEIKVCSKCQRKNPAQVEIHDLASGKMVWEVLTKCMSCRHPFEEKKKPTPELTELDQLAQQLFQEEFAAQEKPQQSSNYLHKMKGSPSPSLNEDSLASLRPLWKKLIVASTKDDLVTALQRVEKEVNNLIHHLEEVNLAWPRGTHALFVECPDTVVSARHIVSSLNLDGATARMIATSKLPKIALYEKSLINVKHFAKRYQQLVNCLAIPIKRETLKSIPNAYPCVRVMPEGFWVGSGPLWSRPNLYSGTSIHLRSEKTELIVSGEVEIQYYKEIRRKKETEWQKHRTERFSIIDLHSSRSIIRLCNHYTDLSVLPKFQSSASQHNFKLYRQNLTNLFPASILIDGYRALPPELGLGSKPAQGTVISGWPQWEAYTRACRLLYRI